MQDLNDIIQKYRMYIPEDDIPDEGIYKITQGAHDFVHNRLPKRLQNYVTVEVMIEAFVGGYLTTRALQWTSENVVDKYVWEYMPDYIKEHFPSFHNNILPKLERACEIGIPLTLVAYLAYKPKNLKKWRDNLGMILAFTAGVIAAEQDLRKHYRERQKL